MKYEWKKQDKVFYSAKKTPTVISIPDQNFIAIDGKGDPNNEDFSNKVAALFSLAYAIKLDFKTIAAKENYQGDITDYSVYPLEGIWSRQQDTEFIKENRLVKDNLAYTIMIRQPDFITENMAAASLEKIKLKKPNHLYSKIYFCTMQDGKCIEVLHVGPFDDEPASFGKMDHFAALNNLRRTTAYHREIYLNNFNRTEKSRLKTILRYSVECCKS